MDDRQVERHRLKVSKGRRQNQQRERKSLERSL